LISALNVIHFGDLLPSDILVDEIPEDFLRPSVRPQRLMSKSPYSQMPFSAWMRRSFDRFGWRRPKGILFAQGASDSKYQSALKPDPETNANTNGW
jgi:hypothetical protein